MEIPEAVGLGDKI